MGVERAWYGLGPDVFQNRCVIKAPQQNLMFGICTYIHKKEHACNFKRHTKPLSFLPLYSSHRSIQGRYPDLNACTEFRTNQLLARYVARLSGGNGVGGGRRAEGWHRSGKGVGQGRAERGGSKISPVPDEYGPLKAVRGKCIALKQRCLSQCNNWLRRTNPPKIYLLRRCQTCSSTSHT